MANFPNVDASWGINTSVRVGTNMDSFIIHPNESQEPIKTLIFEGRLNVHLLQHSASKKPKSCKECKNVLKLKKNRPEKLDPAGPQDGWRVLKRTQQAQQ